MNTSPFLLENKTILVTGASSGLGRAIAIEIARFGGNPILCGRNQERLEAVATKIESEFSIRPKTESFDLENLDEIPNWMKIKSPEWGILNGVVHSAGLHEARPIRTLSSESMDRIYRVNVIAAGMLLRGFRQKGVSDGGSVVLLSSAAGIKGEAVIASYSASKGALIALARSSAVELAKERIRVNCLAPSVVRTEMTADLESNLSEDQFATIIAKHPLGLGTPEDVAYSAIFLLSDAARWITGTTLVVDGGYTAS